MTQPPTQTPPTPLKPPAAAYHKLEESLRHKTRAVFTASLSEGRNPRFIAINHELVPCDPSRLRRAGKPMPIRVTLVRPLTGGFTSAPYKAGQKNDVFTQKLSELCTLQADPFSSSSSSASHSSNHNGAGTCEAGNPNSIAANAGNGNTTAMVVRRPAMRMWSFKKSAKNTDKGQRIDELSWCLEGGNTVILWIDEERINKTAVDRAAGRIGKYYEPVVPENISHIPAFTVCEVTLSSRCDEYACKGNSIKIASIRPASYTLYSCLNDLRLLPPTLEQARLYQMELKLQYPAIANDLDTKDVPFWSRIDPGAVLDDSDVDVNSTVRLCQWGDPSVPQIDLQAEVLLRATNTTRMEYACALLDVAIVCGAASVMVFTNDFWAKNRETGYRGVPLVDVELLLRAVTAASVASAPLVSGATLPTMANGEEDHREYLAFETGHVASLDGERHSVQVLVCPFVESVANGPVPVASDLSLCGLDSELAAAHMVVFNMTSLESGERQLAVFRGFLNATQNKIVPLGGGGGGGGQKRKRFQTMLCD